MISRVVSIFKIDTLFKTILLAAIVLGLTACSEEQRTELVAAEKKNTQREGMPSNREIFAWVQDIVSFGSRRTGSEAGIKAADYMATKFKAFGLENVTIEQGKAMQWEAKNWSLSVDGQNIPAFYIPRSFHPPKAETGAFSTGSNGLRAEMVYVGDAKTFDDIDVKGKIVVADVMLGELDFSRISLMRLAASYVHDSDGSLADASHIDPFTPNNYPFNYIHAMDRGAVGFVGILSNYIDSSSFHNEDVAYMVRSDAYLELPGLWVTRTEGEQIKALLNESNKPVHAELHLEAELKETTYNTVLGYLPGASDETIMVQSHHDSAFDGAVEDASGSAEVLALAKYYSEQPAAERNRRMMFITMDTHFTEYESHQDFARKYILEEDNKNIVANVTIEHIAREMAVEDGQGVMTGKVEPRIFIVSDNDTVMDITEDAVRHHDYHRSLVVSGGLFGEVSDGIPTDADFVYRTGVPVVSLVSGPLYLYDIMDTIDKVAVEELQPTALLFADIIDALDEVPASKLVP